MKHKSNDTPSTIRNDEKYINEPITIANTFNDFFISIAETIQFSNKSFKSFLSSKKNNFFIITATNKEEICKIIHLSILANLVGLIVFQLKFYALSNIKYLNILQLYVTKN